MPTDCSAFHALLTLASYNYSINKSFFQISQSPGFHKIHDIPARKSTFLP